MDSPLTGIKLGTRHVVRLRVNLLIGPPVRDEQNKKLESLEVKVLPLFSPVNRSQE